MLKINNKLFCIKNKQFSIFICRQAYWPFETNALSKNVECLLVFIIYSCVPIFFRFQIQPTTIEYTHGLTNNNVVTSPSMYRMTNNWFGLELEPSDWLKGYAVITIFRTRGIVIQIAHEYGETFQVNDFFS